MALSGQRLRESFVLQYLVLICLFFFSLTILSTVLILQRMNLFSTVKSINEYLCMKRIVYQFALKSMPRDFRYLLLKTSGKRYPLMYYNMTEISEICLLFILLLKWELFEVDFFSRLRLIFIWQVLWCSFGEDKLHLKISENSEYVLAPNVVFPYFHLESVIILRKKWVSCISVIKALTDNHEAHQ